MSKTTSIKKSNIGVQHQSGKAGLIRYYQRHGLTYIRAAHNSVVTNPRTSAQMKHRLQFASLTQLWRVFNGNLKGSFTRKAVNQSDFNGFIAANKAQGCYFTKDQLFHMPSVAMPVQISDGNITSIAIEMVEDANGNKKLETNLSLGTLVIDATTTVADFSKAIVGANTDVEFGDELVFISALQGTKKTVGVGGAYVVVPTVKTAFHRVLLSKTDTRTLHSVVTSDAFQTVNGVLGTINSLPDGGFVYMLSRRDKNNNLCVSSQVLICNNDLTIGTYTSEVQFEKAANTYGTSEDLYIDPGTIATSMASGSITYYTLAVSVASGSEGKGTVSGGGSYAAGSDATIVATPATGKRFVQWSDGNTSASRTITITGDLSLTAEFADNTVADPTLKVQASPSNAGTVQINDLTAGATCQSTFAAGTVVTLKAVPATGCTFSGWSDGNTSAERSYTVSASAVVTATFVDPNASEEGEGGN